MGLLIGSIAQRTHSSILQSFTLAADWTTASGATSFYLTDALGSVVATTNSSQYQASDQRFDAFGNRSAYSGFGSTFGFAAKAQYRTDAESGLLLLGHRYYDPSVGRFLSQDPAQDESNWYSYCGNNPLVATDPTGLYPQANLGGFDGRAKMAAANGQADAFLAQVARKKAGKPEDKLYGSTDAAAVSALDYYWPIADSQQREWGGWIIAIYRKDGKKEVTYYALVGTTHSKSSTPDSLSLGPEPNSAKATWHTHFFAIRAIDSHGNITATIPEQYSYADIAFAHAYGVISYLRTPSHTWAYGPTTRVYRDLSTGQRWSAETR